MVFATQDSLTIANAAHGSNAPMTSSAPSKNSVFPGTALITGSGRKRVGYEIAKHLASQGCHVAVHYHRSAKSAADNVRALRELGVEAESFQADVTQENEVEHLVDSVVERFGAIDVLVTTSSIWNSIPLEKTTASQVLRSFEVNTLGTFLCCKLVGLQMVSQASGGAIVTFGDSLVEHPYRDHSAYFIAKGSIPSLTKCLAVELGSRNPNVRVNCIEPGPVMLPDDLSAAEQQARINATLSKVADDPAQVASTVSYLAQNTMLNGCIIPLDGGRNVAFEHHRRTS